MYRKFEQVGVPLNVVAELNSMDGLSHMILDRKLATIVPWSAIHDLEASGRVKVFRVKGMNLSRELALCLLGDCPPSPAVGAVSRIVRNLVQTLVLSGKWRYARLCNPV